MQTNSLSLLELTRLVASLVQRPETQNVWVTAELSDVAVRGGHCYMELLQKDERLNEWWPRHAGLYGQATSHGLTRNFLQPQASGSPPG